MKLQNAFSSSSRIITSLARSTRTRIPSLVSQKSFISGNAAGRQEQSAVHRGTQFEHRSQALLQKQLSMSLSRVGGRGDGGIDLQGWWWLPDNNQNSELLSIALDDDGRRRRRLRIIAQCKAERRKLGPNYIREMEGVLHRHMFSASKNPPLSEATPTIALLISESSFTKAAILRALSSPVPFLLIHLPPVGETLSSGECYHVGSALWNPVLSGENGVLGGEFEIRWERSLSASGGVQLNPSEGRPGLWWRGERLRSWTPGCGYAD